MNAQKNIVLGVTGSIAAHRAIDLASLLTKAGSRVNVVLTADARLWTRDKRLRSAADALGCGFSDNTAH